MQRHMVADGIVEPVARQVGVTGSHAVQEAGQEAPLIQPT